MNYYEKHLGDYLKNAAHLTLLEHGVYSRLMDVYYVREAPIPADKAARLIAARSDDELQALQVVLQEFFKLRDGFWHQSRCDEDIAEYVAGEPEREAKKANELTRLQRHREERARLFESLTAAGEHLPYNVSISELRSAVARVSGSVSMTVQTGNAATGTLTPATATQTPDTNPHSPVPNTQTPKEKTKDRGAGGPAEPVTPSQAGSACLALRRAGVQDGNTSHPKLLALLARGVTDAELANAAAGVPEAKRKFAYVLAVVEGQRREAATIGALPTNPQRAAVAQTPADRAARHAAVRAKLGVPDPDDQEIIDARP